MDFFQNASDDQIALMGCFVALFTSAALMYLSVYLSRTQRQSQIHKTTSRTIALTAREERSVAPTEAAPRKVA